MNAELAHDAAELAQFPADGLPEVAVLGRSNVGKSRLLNALVNIGGLARISRSPGRTQTINFYSINDRFYYVHLPGYGYAKVPKTVQADVVEAIRRTGRTRLPIRTWVFG